MDANRDRCGVCGERAAPIVATIPVFGEQVPACDACLGPLPSAALEEPRTKPGRRVEARP